MAMGSESAGDGEVKSTKAPLKPLSKDILTKLRARKSEGQKDEPAANLSGDPASEITGQSDATAGVSSGNGVAGGVAGGANSTRVSQAGKAGAAAGKAGAKDAINKETQEAEDAEGNAEINRQTFEHFHPAPGATEAVKAAWTMFLARYSSREGAGEAIFQALFETAPSLQVLFTSSRAVQAMKFMIALNDLVMFMENPEALQAFVETLGFQHLHIQMTSARVAIFRDAICDVFAFELGDSLAEDAKAGLSALLNYVGGGLIYVRTHYADRLRILTESWKFVTDKAAGAKNQAAMHSDSGSELGDSGSEEGTNGMAQHHFDQHKEGKRWWQKLRRKNNATDSGHGNHSEDKENNTAKSAALEVEKKMPTTFSEMFAVNAAVMGVAVNTWMVEVLEVFDALVSNVANSARMKEESDVLALRLSKYEQKELELSDFKACMLAALRSLLPKQWSPAHETAWTWMWENVARLLQQTLELPPRYEKALIGFLDSMDEAALFNMRKDTYVKFFEAAPAGQYYFKQSNTRLHFIAERVNQMTLELLKNPKRMVQDISALGLRHVEFGIPTDLFAPFVSASVEVMCSRSTDHDAIDGYRWSLGLISRILVRTINEGSTLVMKAINFNSIKQLKKAIGSAPRRERDAWFLDIQVGTQSISPLSWAIESGALEVAKCIIKDLLTIRSDRENYYFGAPMLFRRHPDIVRRLVEDAPMLLPTLLDGLIWRSHRPESGHRRVNYYIKHLLVNEDGEFADALKWLAATGDPAIIAHPVVTMVSDTLWTGVVYRQFIVNKMWNVLSLIIFILSQGILPRMVVVPDIEDSEKEKLNILVFAGRLFTYCLSMLNLAVFHLARIWTWVRTTLKRIFDEIDEDGSGTIEWDEFWAAMTLLRQSIRAEIMKAFRFLRDDDGPATMEDARKSIATQSKNMYNIISFVLMVLLAIMLTHEPMIWCMRSSDWPTAECDELENNSLKYRYSIFSCSALVIHWMILVDLTVFSTKISAFLLVINAVMGEVKTFLTALTFLLFMFGSALPIFCATKCPLVAGNFSSLPRAMLSLFAITLGWFEADDVMKIRDSDRVLLAILMVFVGLSVILLLNLLIAQLNRSYEYIYQDMLGFARLNRASLIVEAMFSCAKSKWKRFRDGCGFETKLEFDAGDLGLAGGIQVTEPQGHGDVLEDMIHRFGGSTSPESPWPEEKSATEDTDDRFDRLELLLQKALKRMGTSKGGGGGGTGTGSGGGSGGDTGTGTLQESVQRGTGGSDRSSSSSSRGGR